MLPVSGLSVRCSEPTGEEELLLLETHDVSRATLQSIIDRVVVVDDGRPLSCGDLPAVELGTLALLLRRAWLGETITTDTACGNRFCHERIDIAFDIQGYLDHHLPNPTTELHCGTDGWWALPDTDVGFRIPTVDDIAACAGTDDPAGEWAQRCVRSTDLDAATTEQIDAALQSIAPSLADEVAAECPTCGEVTTLWFEPVSFVVGELAGHFREIYTEIGVIASAFGWSEAEIVRLQRARRAGYLAAIAQRHGAAS